MKIVADDKIPFLRGALEPFVDMVYLPGNMISKADLIDADALIIRTRTQCNADLLQGTNVKFIATATIGFDHIDIQYCDEQGIIWANSQGCNSGSVFQYVASALLTIAEKKNIELRNRVLGVVGVGNVGKKIIRLGECFGMQVIVNDPPRARKEGVCGFNTLDGICREADIITFHVPLTFEGADKTYHLVNHNFFKKLNPDTIIINSSRGEVVGSIACLDALENGILSEAILDVWESEPNINFDLYKKCFLATPHIAGYSTDGKANGTMMSVRAISKFFKFGIDDWEPNELPMPKKSVIEINGENKTEQKILAKAILNTYNISDDHNKLNKEFDKFEKIRGEYPLRREFMAYQLKLKDVPDKTQKILQKLGFKLIQ